MARGLLTFALLPSPGLQVVRQSSPKSPFEYGNIDVTANHSTVGNAVVFTGESFKQLSRNDIPTRGYRVIAQPTPRVSLLYQLQLRPGTYPPRLESDYELMLARGSALPPSPVVSKTMALTGIYTTNRPDHVNVHLYLV
jgi:hypothetical protein